MSESTVIPVSYVWEVSARSKEIRDEALEKARKIPDVKILFVGQREEDLFVGQYKNYNWVFIYTRKDNNRPASEITGCKEYPDSAEYTELVKFSATAFMKID